MNRKLVILTLLVLFASTRQLDTNLQEETLDHLKPQSSQDFFDGSTSRRLLKEPQDFPTLSQDQSFNSLDNGIGNQNMQFGTFQNQQTSSQNTNDLQPSAQEFNAKNDQNQQGTTQKQVSSNSNPNSQDQSLVAPKKEEPKILLAQIQKPVLGKGLKINQGISYQRLHVGKIQKKFLFIDFILAQKDKWQKVNISISLQGSEYRIIQCQYDGHDSCYIPSNELKEDSVLFLNIKCQDECIYNLNSHWSDLEHLTPGKSYVFAFGKQTFQLYHVELEGMDFQEFRVHIAPRTTRRPFDNIKIYGKYGSDTGITTNNYDFQSINLWQDGQGLFLRPNDLKSKNFDLLLIGQTQSTYQLLCQIIKQSTHQIEDGEHIYEYLKARESKSYHIANFNTKRFEQFSLKVSVLSGNVEVEYFYDKQLKKKLPYTPYKYMDDSQYIFQANQIAQFASNGLYVKVTSKEMEGQQARDATFTIKFESRHKSDAIELKQHVYGFVTVNQTKFAYFNFKRWLQQFETTLKFTVSALQVLGTSKLEFFICKDKLYSCTDPQKYKITTDPVPQGKKNRQQLSQKERYQFQISDSYLRQINNLEEEGIIVVRITNEGEKNKENSYGFNLVALEFINNNKVLMLREGRPLEDKLMANEMKIYKYINSDENVKEIRIHVNEIAGVIKLSGAIKDPSSQKTQNIQPEGTTLKFTKNLTQPLLVAIRAQSKSIFGISMQIILKGQSTGVADVRVIGEDLAYTVRINPSAYTIFEITPMFYEFLFKYESSQSIIACVIDESGECIPQGDKDKSTYQNAPRPTQKGQLKKAILSKERKARVKITNPFSDSAAQVTIIFHSRIFDHCDLKKVGRAYSQNVKNGTCYSFLLQGEQKQGLQMYISKRQLANMTYSVLICGNSVNNVMKLKTLNLSPQIIYDQCKNSLQAKQISIYWSVNTTNYVANDLNVKVDYVLQKTGGVIVLPEGLSYSVFTKARDGVIKTFGFSLINLLDTRIYIHQTIGKFRAYAKLIREDDKDTENVTEINNQFSSVNSLSYEQEPIIFVSKAKMEKMKCERCFLLIAVYSDSQQGRTIQFEIQVVQRFQSLNDDSSVKGYLQAGSTAYYTYRAKESKKQHTALIFFLSDNHQRCANMYLHYHQYPGPNFNIMKSFESNELIYNHLGPETKYFLAVQAKRTCDYALSVLLYDTSIHRLQRGKQNMLKLLKGEVRYFTFQQYTDEPFKILSLSRFGEVRLHLNKSGIAIDKRTFTTDQLNIQKFDVKSQNQNALAVSTSDKIYCKNCSYFLAAEAMSTTFATLFLVYPSTIVPLYKNKFFADYLLQKKDKTLASYNSLEKSKLQIVVHSGSIQITVVYKQYKKIQTFHAKSDLQAMIVEINDQIIKGQGQGQGNHLAKPQYDKKDPYFYSMPNSPTYQQKTPINFIITALFDKSSYTLQLKSLQSKGELTGYSEYQTIKSGQPNHIQISNNRVLCIEGVINDDQQILLTTNTDNEDKLKGIVFNAKLRQNTNAKVKTQILKNVVAIKLQEQNSKDKPAYGASDYQVCLKLNTTEEEEKQVKDDKKTEKEKEKIVKQEQQKNITQSQQGFDEENNFTFKAVVTQANSVNIIPSDTQTLVRGTQTFVVHSDGEFILDVFECQGDAKVSYSDSLASLKSSKPKLIESVSISEQKHAVKIVQSDTTFINVTSKNAIIRWLPLNVQTDQGSGYLKFEAGDIKYSSKFKYMNIEYQPLQLKKRTKSKVSQVKYILYITNNPQLLEYNAQCSPNRSDDIVEIALDQVPYTTNPEYQKQYLGRTIQKNFLSNRFNGSENIYFTIVAKLVLEVSKKVVKNPKFQTSISDSHQHYRFIYNRQQMPLETYMPSKIQAIPYGFLGLIVGSILLVLLVVTYLFTRKIAPWIARLRSRHLVQDQDPNQNKQDLQMVPPSSDRNQRAPDTALQTQEKMKS